MKIGEYYVYQGADWKFIFRISQIEGTTIGVENYLDVDPDYPEDYKPGTSNFAETDSESIRECSAEELTWIKACEKEGKYLTLEEALQTITYEIW